MKVLIIAPHMDDEVLGCGGIICKHKAQKDTVDVVFIAHRIYDHVFQKDKSDLEQSHALEAKKILGSDSAAFLDLADEQLDASVQNIIVALEKVVASKQADIVYLPFRGDNHQDHRAVFDACRVVFRPSATASLKTLYMYETPSSTEQSPPMLENAFLPNHFADISEHCEKKIAALRSYETEQRTFPHPRSPEAVMTLAQKRGIECGCRYAESFMIIRDMWR